MKQEKEQKRRDDYLDSLKIGMISSLIILVTSKYEKGECLLLLTSFSTTLLVIYS